MGPIGWIAQRVTTRYASPRRVTDGLIAGQGCGRWALSGVLSGRLAVSDHLQ